MPCKFCGTNQPDKKKCKVCNEKICKRCIPDYAEYRSSGLKCNGCVGQRSRGFFYNEHQKAENARNYNYSSSKTKDESIKYYCGACGGKMPYDLRGMCRLCLETSDHQTSYKY